MNPSEATQLEPLRIKLRHLREATAKQPCAEEVGVRSAYSSFLNALYSLDEELKHLSGRKELEGAKAKLPEADRKLLQSMLNKRGSDTHDGKLKINPKEKIIRAEEAQGVSVVGSLLPPTQAEIEAAEEVGMKPGWQAGVSVFEYYIPFRTHADMGVTEACQRCVNLFESVIAYLP